MSSIDLKKSICAQLKAAGYSSHQVSVREEPGGEYCLNIRIKNDTVDEEVVSDIAFNAVAEVIAGGVEFTTSVSMLFSGLECIFTLMPSGCLTGE